MSGQIPDLLPPASSNETFSWGAWIGGLVIALCAGGVLNIFSGLIGMATNLAIGGLLVGAVPGLLFVGIGLLVRRRSPAFAGGLLVGGCIIALIGGACGASMVGTSFH